MCSGARQQQSRRGGHTALPVPSAASPPAPPHPPPWQLCDFGYSKHDTLDSVAKSKVGTPGYTAPGEAAGWAARKACPGPGHGAAGGKAVPTRMRQRLPGSCLCGSAGTDVPLFVDIMPCAASCNVARRSQPSLLFASSQRAVAAACPPCAEVIQNVRGYDGKMADIWSAGAAMPRGQGQEARVAAEAPDAGTAVCAVAVGASGARGRRCPGAGAFCVESQGPWPPCVYHPPPRRRDAIHDAVCAVPL